MMTEFSTYSAPVIREPSWRDRLEYLGKTPRQRSAMSA